MPLIRTPYHGDRRHMRAVNTTPAHQAIEMDQSGEQADATALALQLLENCPSLAAAEAALRHAARRREQSRNRRVGRI